MERRLRDPLLTAIGPGLCIEFEVSLPISLPASSYQDVARQAAKCEPVPADRHAGWQRGPSLARASAIIGCHKRLSVMRWAGPIRWQMGLLCQPARQSILLTALDGATRPRRGRGPFHNISRYAGRGLFHSDPFERPWRDGCGLGIVSSTAPFENGTYGR